MKLNVEDWRELLRNSGIRVSQADLEWLARVSAAQPAPIPPRLETEPQLVQVPEPWKRPQ
jgi:hypothetical protein